MRAYIAYGTGIESDFPLGALPLSMNRSSVSFRVAHADALKDAAPELTKLCHSQGRNVYIQVRDDAVIVRVDSFASFKLLPTSGVIDCLCLSLVPDVLLRYWFIQQILPIYLLWKGTAEFLHGMAVGANLDDAIRPSQSIGFMGDSYAGKSTLLSYFLSRGHTLISDDHLAISRENYMDVLPATPYYRPYRAGEDLGHVAANFSPEPVPLKRLYLLEPTFGYADIKLESVEGVNAIKALLPHVQYNVHNPGLPQLFPLVAERFSGLNRLVRQVTLKRLYVPRNLNRLAEVYDFIQNDLAS